MSDVTFQARMLVCDWAGCNQITDPDSREEDWLHTEEGRDYCPKHWHLDEEWQQVPGPDTEPPVPVEEQERFQRIFKKYHDRRTDRWEKA